MKIKINTNEKNNISLRHSLNKTQYNLFHMFSDPFKMTSNELYKKINAINNVYNNVKYYKYRNRKIIKEIILTEDKSSNKLRKNNDLSNSKNSSYKQFENIDNNKYLKINKSNAEDSFKNKSNSQKGLTPNKYSRGKHNIKKMFQKYGFLGFNELSQFSKISHDYNKIIKGKLDEELVINSRNAEEAKKSNFNKLVYNKNDNNKNIDKGFNKIFKSVKADNKIFNNCLITKKIIYDIKPLNKLNEKGKCSFPKNLIDKKCKTESTLLLNDSFIKNWCYEKININSNLTSCSKNKDIYQIYRGKSYNNLENKNIDRNNGYSKVKLKKKNKRIFLKTLCKYLPNNNKNKTIFIYYKDGVGVTRGEKLKFLKTTYPINLIKPLNTQQFYKLKKPNDIEEIKEIMINKYPINHYNLDVLNKSNKRLIKNLEQTQNNISNKIKNEFTLLNNSINEIDRKDSIQNFI